MHSDTVGLPPSEGECREAVARAIGARLKEYRTAILLQHLTDAALQERLTSFPLPNAERRRNGWWRVGTIVDQIADQDLDVWYRPGPPRALATSERKRPTYVETTPPAVVPDGIRALYRANWENRGKASGS